MLVYVFRVIKKNIVSFVFSVFAVAIAIASLSACLAIYQTLVAGKPVGTNYQGTEVSLFTYSSAHKTSFFLDPSQILNLQTDLGTRGDIIAASGGRYKGVTINHDIIHSVVDIVSDNFFDVLNIKFTQGSSNGFNGDQPVCLLSASYITKLGLTSPPQSIVIASKSYKVIGVVDTFKGLFDAETEIWVPWQHGHNILFPALKDRGILRQPGLYWTVVIANHTNRDEFDTIIEQLKSRTDLLFPPFDSFKSIKGISWSEDKHDSAKQSTMLYLYISLLIFIVSILNLSTWISLARFSRLANELTFLKLGIPQRLYISYHLLLVVLPIVCAFVIAYPIYHWYMYLIRQEPAIMDLFLHSTEYLRPDVGLNLVLMFVFALLTTYGISWLIGKASAIGFFVSTLQQKTKSIPVIFRLMMFFAALFATISLIFALFTAQYGIDAISLFKKNPNQIYYSSVSSGAKIMDNQLLSSYFNAIKQDNLEIAQIGIMEYAPLLNLVGAQEFSLQEYGDPDISVALNSTSLNALSALDITLKNGELFVRDTTNQIVVDENTEKKLIELTGQQNIIGLSLYDSSSDIYNIVGVVTNVNYSDNPTSVILMSYTNFNMNNSQGILVVQGDVTQTKLETSLKQIDEQFGIQAAKVISYHQLMQDKRNPYISRLLLCISAALVAIFISALTLFSIANIDIQYRKKNLAIYACLGLSPLNLWWQANKNLVLVIISGFVIGALLFWWQRNNDVVQIIVINNDWFTTIALSFLFMVLITVASISFAFWQIFASKPLYNHLKCDE